LAGQGRTHAGRGLRVVAADRKERSAQRSGKPAPRATKELLLRSHTRSLVRRCRAPQALRFTSALRRTAAQNRPAAADTCRTPRRTLAPRAPAAAGPRTQFRTTPRP